MCSLNTWVHNDSLGIWLSLKDSIESIPYFLTLVFPKEKNLGISHHLFTEAVLDISLECISMSILINPSVLCISYIFKYLFVLFVYLTALSLKLPHAGSIVVAYELLVAACGI